MLKKLPILIFVFLIFRAEAQIGGNKTYRFLDIPMTARAAALGGNNMSIWDNDINLIYSNPALLSPRMVKQAAFNYCNYVGDLNFFSVAYAQDFKKKGTAAMSLQTFNYGNFVGYDALGNKTGNFKANDFSLNVNYAKSLADSMFNVGLCLKTIVSQYEIYKSFGNAIDFGITFHNKNNLVISLVAKNVGFIWKSYSNLQSEREKLPQTVQFGISKKVEKAPFKLFFVYDQLLKWNLKYISPIDTAGKQGTLNSGEIGKDSTNWQRFKVKTGGNLDNFMRHFTFGTEVVLTKNFHLRLAYNYRRQREMTLPERRGANGLSFGFGLTIRRLAFSYSFTKMAFPGNSNIIGLTFKW